MPAYLEFKLSWLIDRADLTTSNPYRRLNAIENLITQLAHQWRDHLRPLDVAREIRMSEATRLSMRAWIEAEQIATGETIVRLAAYGSAAVRDQSVAEGWIRLITPRTSRWS